MNTDERTKIMNAIAAAGDATVREFGAHCMAWLEATGTFTDEDARNFAENKGLL